MHVYIKKHFWQKFILIRNICIFVTKSLFLLFSILFILKSKMRNHIPFLKKKIMYRTIYFLIIYTTIFMTLQIKPRNTLRQNKQINMTITVIVDT